MLPAVSILLAFVPLLALAKVEPASESYQFEPLEHLAGIAPYFTPEDPPKDPAPPQGCTVTRAAYLVRHAAIYANDFDYEEYIEPFVEKLANTSQDWTQTQELHFLSSWTSPIEDEDLEDLTRFGQLEAMRLGIDLYQRYKGFKAPKKVWTSTAERTVLSAESLIRGLVSKQNETKLVQVYEGEEDGANTLTPYEGCPNYSSSAGSDQSTAFTKRYTKPIIGRLQAAAPSFNFTASDIYGMQQLCGYETVIRGSSPFCSLTLFTPDEWLAFEYANDIMYHYNTGYGSPYSGAIGFPWVNATLAKLTASNSTNSTVQDLYVSFTHRELPPTVLVALGLFNNSAFSGSDKPNATMPTDAINHRRAWKSSHMLQFLTNIAIEKMSCASYGYDAGDFYRVLVNSAPQPLMGCTDGPGESCSASGLTDFMSGREAMFGGFGQICGVDYSNSTDVLGIYNGS